MKRSFVSGILKRINDLMLELLEGDVIRILDY